MTKAFTLTVIAFGALGVACGPSSGDTGATSGAGASTGTGGGVAQVTSSGPGGATGGGGSVGSGAGGGGGSTGIAPTILATSPLDGATLVATNTSANVTFSEAMDCASLTAMTFTLTAGANAVPGTVVCASPTAVFWPAAHLPGNSTFTATVTTGARSAGRVHLAANHAWTFTTGDLVAGGLPVSLGLAGDYAVLAKSAISTVPTSAVTGNLGVSPAAATFITGFSLMGDATGVFSRSAQVTGKVYAANYAVPTPFSLTTAVGDMQLAFTDAAGRAPDKTELGAGNLGGLTLAAGVYRWSTGVLIPTDLALAGNANDVWIFQIAGDLTLSSATRVGLTGGALPKNVFWQVAGLVHLGTTAHLEGVVLTQTAITLGSGASVDGRLLAQTAVNLDANVVVEPAP